MGHLDDIAAPRRVDLDAVFELVTLSDLHWSPDGRWIACVASRPDLAANQQRSAVWLVDPDGVAAPRQLTGGQKLDRMPRWSPDGTRLAFVTNRGGSDRVWLIRPDGGEAWPLTGESSGTGPVATDDFYAALDWSPDGTQVAFVAQEPAPPGPRPDDPDFTDVRVVGRDDGEGYGEIRRLQVWAAPAAGGAVRQLTHGDYHSGDCRWSPDGRAIAFVSNRSGDEEAVRWSIDKDFDLWLLDVATGEVRRLTSNPGPDIGPRWSPDGRSIAYTFVPRRGSHRDVFQLAVLDVASGVSRPLTDSEGPHVDRLTDACWSPDGLTIYSTAASRAANVVLVAPADGRWPARPVVAGGRLCEGAALSPDGARLAFAGHDPRRPPEVWLAEVARPCGSAGPGASPLAGPAEAGAPRAVTAFNAGLAGRALAQTEVRCWRSPDGLEIEGLVTLPPDYRDGERRPLLVLPHGGPHSRSALGFNVEWQGWAARGYALLAPNFRGSLGYGQAFLDADRGDFGGGDFADVMSGVDDLIAAGVADAARLAIVGSSYGGFMAAWAIGHTQRFSAAVATEAVVDLLSFYGQTDIKSWIEWEFGYPWEAAAALAAHSPISHVARARTPTLVVHGDEDRRVPLSQSLELYTALRKLGVETQLVRYPRDGHGIEEPRHRRDYLRRIAAWLEAHLESG